MALKPTFFRTPSALRTWLERHHDAARELWVGFYKKHTGRPTITYHEALDEALCMGWIDGIRKSVDEASYTIRFTPRKPKSVWSAVNTRRAGELVEAGLMKPPGLAAFRARDPEASGRYSYEARSAGLDTAYQRKFRTNRRAWTFFASQPPGYRRIASFWVMSARREETRLRRFATLVECSGKGSKLPGLERPPTRRPSTGMEGGRSVGRTRSAARRGGE